MLKKKGLESGYENSGTIFHPKLQLTKRINLKPNIRENHHIVKPQPPVLNNISGNPLAGFRIELEEDDYYGVELTGKATQNSLVTTKIALSYPEKRRGFDFSNRLNTMRFLFFIKNEN